MCNTIETILRMYCTTEEISAGIRGHFKRQTGFGHNGGSHLMGTGGSFLQRREPER